jgi:hypothetical protein
MTPNYTIIVKTEDIITTTLESAPGSKQDKDYVYHLFPVKKVLCAMNKLHNAKL